MSFSIPIKIAGARGVEQEKTIVISSPSVPSVAASASHTNGNAVPFVMQVGNATTPVQVNNPPNVGQVILSSISPVIANAADKNSVAKSVHPVIFQSSSIAESDNAAVGNQSKTLQITLPALPENEQEKVQQQVIAAIANSIPRDQSSNVAQPTQKTSIPVRQDSNVVYRIADAANGNITVVPVEQEKQSVKTTNNADICTSSNSPETNATSNIANVEENKASTDKNR